MTGWSRSTKLRTHLPLMGQARHTVGVVQKQKACCDREIY